MKKMIILLALSSIILAACAESQTVTIVENENVRFAGLKGTVSIIKDNETGCKYIREEYGSGTSLSIALTGLLKSDGTPDCEK